MFVSSVVNSRQVSLTLEATLPPTLPPLTDAHLRSLKELLQKRVKGLILGEILHVFDGLKVYLVGGQLQELLGAEWFIEAGRAIDIYPHEHFQQSFGKTRDCDFRVMYEDKEVTPQMLAEELVQWVAKQLQTTPDIVRGTIFTHFHPVFDFEGAKILTDAFLVTIDGVDILIARQLEHESLISTQDLKLCLNTDEISGKELGGFKAVEDLLKGVVHPTFKSHLTFVKILSKMTEGSRVPHKLPRELFEKIRVLSLGSSLKRALNHLEQHLKGALVFNVLSTFYEHGFWVDEKALIREMELGNSQLEVMLKILPFYQVRALIILKGFFSPRTLLAIHEGHKWLKVEGHLWVRCQWLNALEVLAQNPGLEAYLPSKYERLYLHPTKPSKQLINRLESYPALAQFLRETFYKELKREPLPLSIKDMDSEQIAELKDFSHLSVMDFKNLVFPAINNLIRHHKKELVAPLLEVLKRYELPHDLECFEAILDHFPKLRPHYLNLLFEGLKEQPIPFPLYQKSLFWLQGIPPIEVMNVYRILLKDSDQILEAFSNIPEMLLMEQPVTAAQFFIKRGGPQEKVQAVATALFKKRDPLVFDLLPCMTVTSSYLNTYWDIASKMDGARFYRTYRSLLLNNSELLACVEKATALFLSLHSSPDGLELNLLWRGLQTQDPFTVIRILLFACQTTSSPLVLEKIAEERIRVKERLSKEQYPLIKTLEQTLIRKLGPMSPLFFEYARIIHSDMKHYLVSLKDRQRWFDDLAFLITETGKWYRENQTPFRSLAAASHALSEQFFVGINRERMLKALIHHPSQQTIQGTLVRYVKQLQLIDHLSVLLATFLICLGISYMAPPNK